MASSRERLEREDFFGFAALNQRAHMVGLQGEGIADLALIDRAVVDAGDTRLVTAVLLLLCSLNPQTISFSRRSQG